MVRHAPGENTKGAAVSTPVVKTAPQRNVGPGCQAAAVTHPDLPTGLYELLLTSDVQRSISELRSVISQVDQAEAPDLLGDFVGRQVTRACGT